MTFQWLQIGLEVKACNAISFLYYLQDVLLLVLNSMTENVARKVNRLCPYALAPGEAQQNLSG